jgi:hypothetical protein
VNVFSLLHELLAYDRPSVPKHIAAATSFVQVTVQWLPLNYVAGNENKAMSAMSA